MTQAIATARVDTKAVAREAVKEIPEMINRTVGSAVYSIAESHAIERLLTGAQVRYDANTVYVRFAATARAFWADQFGTAILDRAAEAAGTPLEAGEILTLGRNTMALRFA